MSPGVNLKRASRGCRNEKGPRGCGGLAYRMQSARPEDHI